MKKIMMLSAVGCLVLAGCSGNKKEKVVESDSMSEPVEIATETQGESTVAFITKDSIGHIFVGMPLHEVPDSISGLYTHKENGASPDAVTITFSDSDGEEFISYDFGEGNIDVLNVVGKNIKVNGPDGYFGLGDQFAKILDLPGVETEWSGYDGGGSWYWVWDGLWFAPSQETLTETLSKSLYNYDSAPSTSDFSDNVTIGFIGTGLPF